jgi:hypothetical protein
MYSRDFGGIRSEGQLYNFEREYNESRSRDDFPRERENEPDRAEVASVEKRTGFGLDFLRNLQLDDLILIGIGILLLLDSESENDIFVLIIALLVMF